MIFAEVMENNFSAAIGSCLENVTQLRIGLGYTNFNL